MSELDANLSLERADGGFVALVEGPLADALEGHEAGAGKRLQVCRGGGLGDAQLPRDEDDAAGVLHQVAVLLRRKVRTRILEPLQYLEPFVAREQCEDVCGRHRRAV